MTMADMDRAAETPSPEDSRRPRGVTRAARVRWALRPRRQLDSGPVRIPGRVPVAPLQPEWLIVDQLPLFHRYHIPDPGRSDHGPSVPGPAEAIVHIHGFGISGTYLEPTAAVLASSYRSYVPDLPGMGRSMRPKHGLNLQGLARAVIDYCDAVGVEKPILVGNSLGCPIIIEVAASFPDRVKSAVLVSPAGGPNNQPLGRALRQMAQDGLREPHAMLPIATRDYLRFGVLQSLSLFKAMTSYPTLENLPLLDVPTLVIAGARDPLVRFSNAFVLAALPHVSAVKVPGAHALNFSTPELVAELIQAHLTGQPLLQGALADGVAEMVEVYKAKPPPPGRTGRRRNH
jgi:pimeloyl-ACP methyl ester carboxylesterase